MHFSQTKRTDFNDTTLDLILCNSIIHFDDSTADCLLFNRLPQWEPLMKATTNSFIRPYVSRSHVSDHARAKINGSDACNQTFTKPSVSSSYLHLTNMLCKQTRTSIQRKHETKTTPNDGWRAHADTGATYHGNEVKGPEEVLWNELVRAGSKTGEATAGEAGEAPGAEPRRPSQNDGSYEGTRCYKQQLQVLVTAISYNRRKNKSARIITTASEVTTLWRDRNVCIIIILSLIHISEPTRPY